MSEENAQVAEATQADIATTEDWRTSLPDDIRSAKAFDSVKDVGSLAKQFLDAQSHIGNSIRIPGEDAGQEAVDAFHQKVMTKTNLMVKPDTPEEYQKVFQSMGMPEASDGYTMPEGIEAANYEHLRDLAHNASMTDKQFANVVESVSKLDQAALESQQATLNESRGATQKEWGAAFDRNESEAIALLEATGAPESVVDIAKKGGIDGDSLKWFYALSQKMSAGEGNAASQDKGGNNVMTPSEAASQLDEIMGNTGGPYWNPGHPRHKEMQDKAMRLRRLKSGEAA